MGLCALVSALLVFRRQSLDACVCALQLDHPSVIKLYEVYEDDNNMYLVLEYCSGGELYDRLHAQDGHKYSEQQASRLVFQMLAAIAYCHGMGISHRDLKYVVIVVWLGHWGTVAA